MASRWRLYAGFALIALSLLPVLGDEEGSAKPANEAAPAPIAARLITVSVPLRSADVDRVKGQLQAAVARFPKDGKNRPLLILEFVSAEGTDGQGTLFDDALKLARALTSEELSGVRTIAFLQHSVKGHGVLPVIACDEIIMAPEAELGAAGIDESQIDRVMRASYEDIAERRRTVPMQLAVAMLDPKGELLKVQTPEGSRVVFDSELAELERTTTVTSKETLKPPGSLASFSGNNWRHKLGYVSHLAKDRPELALALKISESLLDENPLSGQKPNAVRINFEGSMHPRLVDRARRTLVDELRSGEINLVIIHFGSGGGSLEAAKDLATDLISIDGKQTRTVAYVSRHGALGSAALVALACDEIIMEEGSQLGGQGDATYHERDFKEILPEVQQILQRHDRSWSPALALMGAQDPIRRWTHLRTGEKRLMSDEEHGQRKDREDWSVDRDNVDLTNGVDPSTAVDLGLAQHRAHTFDDVNNLYHIEDKVRTAGVNWALVFIERLADPRLSGLLLFIGTFALFSELSQPGLGVPGFIAAVCFLLFFWANFLHGTAEILELLLFAAGVACVFIELFVTPGAMIFGVGGALMIVISIVLASQTFVVPTNAYQLHQLPSSLLMVAGGGAGGIIGIIVLQRFLPHTPYFKRLILQPPVQEEVAQIQQRERLASFDYLLGKRGIALTPLVPAGKAQFGDDVVDVMSDGALIEVGSEVTVIETLANRIRVRLIDR